MSKLATLLRITVLALSSLAMVGCVFAQSKPKPSVSEFTLAYLDKSYDVLPSATSTTNPYSGETTNITNSGYRVINKTVEITVKNQPLTSYEINGETVKVYFNVRFQGHYGTEWITLILTLPSVTQPKTQLLITQK